MFLAKNLQRVAHRPVQSGFGVNITAKWFPTVSLMMPLPQCYKLTQIQSRTFRRNNDWSDSDGEEYQGNRRNNRGGDSFSDNRRDRGGSSRYQDDRRRDDGGRGGRYEKSYDNDDYVFE